MAIDIKITSDDTIEHEGKTYKPVAIRCPKKGELILPQAGKPHRATSDYRHAIHVILEEVIPPYRTPTDEDAKQRPMAEFWLCDSGTKLQGTLLAVIPSQAFPFIAMMNKATVPCAVPNCRIPNEGATE